MNKKHIEERLDHKHLGVTILNIHSDHTKHRYKLENEPKKQPNRFFLEKELATKVIMDCKAIAAHKFKTRLGLKQYGVILTKEQSVLTKIKSSFKGENMQI